jgi:hypothetical protein
MSLTLIEESAKEVRRLAIAGSPLAVGDFRLKKLILPLEQAGAKVPVFGQVAKSIGELVNGNEAESAARLLSLSTLLNAILYTQGQTGADGDTRELELFPANCSSTRTTARVLKPLVEALTTVGGGRFEVIKAAVERGAFSDLRLIEPAMRALDDNYSEIADLVAERVLHTYGPGIAPLLEGKLDLKGKKSDARRLSVLHRLDPAGTVELCKTALEDGSADVKVAAIACLGKHEDCIPLVLEQVNSKNKALRAAALEALAEHDRPEIISLFRDMIKGKTLEMLARPFRALRNPQVLNSLLSEGKRVFDLLLKGDNEQISRFSEILDCLQQRKEAEAAGFLLTCFGQCEKLAKLKPAKNSTLGGIDLLAVMASLVYNTGSPEAREAVLSKHQVLPPAAFGLVLRSALLTWSADKVYEEFAPLLDQKKGAGKEKNNELQHTILAIDHADVLDLEDLDDSSGVDETLKTVEWDARWLDAAIKADEALLVCSFARPAHKGAVDYLLKALEAPKHGFQVERIMETLARCQYPKITDAFLNLVTKRTKGGGAFHYELQLLLTSARYLPPADLSRLDAFAPKLDEKYVDRFLEALEPLRQKIRGQDATNSEL